MAGLRSSYELQKWAAIQKTASAPLQKVRDGIYSQKDVDALGTALKDYDDLAYSVFAEGIRLAEIAAKDRIDTVQTKRQAKSKKPLTARQMSIIYGQAVEKAQKETMPALLSAIQEMLDAQGTSLEEVAATGAPERRPNLGEAAVPRPTQFTLDRFIPQQASNEDLADDTLEKFKKYDEESWLRKLDQIARLIGDHRDTRPHPSVVPFGGDDEDDEDDFDDDKTTVVPTPHPSTTSASPVVTPSTQNASPAERKAARVAAQAAAKEQRRKAEKRKAEYSRGMFHGLVNNIDRKKKLADIREQRIMTGQRKEGSLHKGKRLLGNTKDEASELLSYVKSKYSKLTGLGRKASDGASTLLMLALGLSALGGVVEGLIGKFTEFKLLDTIQDVFSKSFTWVVDKIFEFVGLDRKKIKADRDATDKRTHDAEVGTGLSDKTGGTAVTSDPAKAKAYLEATKSFTAAEAADFTKKTGLAVPKEKINDKQRYNKYQTPEQTAALAKAGAPNPVGGSPAPGSGSPSPTKSSTAATAEAPKVASPALTTTAAEAPKVASPAALVSAAPTSTVPAPASSPSKGGMTANMNMAVTTAPSATVATLPQSGSPKAVTAEAPQASSASQAATTPQASAPQQSSRAPVSLATCPSDSACRDSNHITNLPGMR